MTSRAASISLTPTRQLAALAFYVLLAVLAFSQPLFHLTTHVPGGPHTDYFHFHWNYWWIRHVLTSPALDTIYLSDYVMFPAVSNLAYHTLTPVWFPLWALLEPALGTVGAMNLIFVIALALTGWLAFVLLVREGVAPGWALLGGVALQFPPFIFHALHMSWLSMLGWFWLPAHLLLWGKIAASVQRGVALRRGLPWALLMGAGLWAMGLTDVQYFLFLALLLVPYGLLTLVETPGWTVRLRLCGLGALAITLGLGLLWIAGPLSYMGELDAGTLVRAEAERAFSLDFPRDYFLRDDHYFGTFPPVSVGAVLMPLLLLALAVNLRRRRRSRGLSQRRWFWFALVWPPLILAAGATLHLFGWEIPLPYRLLHEALGGMFRFPLRFSLVMILPVMIFAGLTLGAFIRGRARLWLVAGVLLLMLADLRTLRPLPIQTPPTPYTFYQTMGAERGPLYDDYVVVEVPTAAGTGEGWVGDARAIIHQFHGITHGKRMVNGHLSRAPVMHFWHMRTDHPTLSWLGQRRDLEPERVAAQLREMIHDWPIGYIVIHQDLIGRDTATNEEIIGFFNALDDLLCPVFIEGEAVVYRSVWHPDGCPPRTPAEIAPGVYRVDLGTPEDARHIGWGWHRPEEVAGLAVRWAGEYPQAEIYVDLPPGEYTLNIAAQAFLEPRTVTVLLDGATLGAAEIVPDTLATYSFTIPAELTGDGQHLSLTLGYDGWIVPAESGHSGDPRRLALMVERIEFVRAGEP